ncbi:MAG: hypothetical protein KDC69_12595, partial [Flavobacteriaceae bacterium]|nr:hypothetical protein [Flavobacteriaceae bacterium]
MKIVTVLIYGLLFLQSFVENCHGDDGFSIILGDCFHGDTISLAINNQKLIESGVVTSNFSTGLTGWYVYQDKKELLLINGANTIESE